MTTTLRLSLLCCLLFSLLNVQAQNINITPRFPTVTQNNVASPLGFGGGMNSPQFSAADFNNDGQEDFFVFDRVGNVPMAFEKDVNGNWRMRPELLVNFPVMENWVLLRDYNLDGIIDIFTHNSTTASGIKVFTGSYSPEGVIDFERFEFANELDIIFVPSSGGAETQLYVSNIDYPGIDDIDCDGDLDVLTFNISGGFLDWYKNLSVENGYGTDSLIFVLHDDCYGGIYESGLSPELDLAVSADECANGIVDGEVDDRHVGSTILTFDEDGDGDHDLVLGDLSFPTLTYATNGNGCEDAWMVAQDIAFPSYDVSANLPLFPAAFYLDIDGDQVRDLVVASNEDNIGIDHDNVWYYRNTATDDNPTFQFDKNDLLVGGMIDLGSRSHPALLDYNADGLMDIVVGNFSFYAEFGFKNSRLHLYENTGTATSPAFTLADDDYLGMAEFNGDTPGQGTFGFAPVFGDLDGDGDMDALVGDIDGKLFHFENIAGAGQVAAFGPATYNYMGIDIGQSAVPQIVDLNRDGLADIVIGEKNGNINYLQNVGSPGDPQFGNDEEVLPNVRVLGQVDARIPGFSTGYAAPFFVDIDGEYHLFVGTQSGTLEHYRGIEGNLAGGAFAVANENLADNTAGIHLQPVLWDWDNDDFYDMALGNERGGLNFFAANLLLNGTVNTDAPTAQNLPWRAYPNPVTDQLLVEWNDPAEAALLLYDQCGGLLWEGTVEGNSQRRITVGNYPAGLYFLQVRSAGGNEVRKVVVE